MDNLQIAKEWFDIAKMDIASAKFLQSMHPIPIEIICYHCQQSSEKYLKGYLALNGSEIIKTHDLVLLNKLCCKYNKKFINIEDECFRLTDYGVIVRYPYPMDLNSADMKLAIIDAGKIKNFTLTKVDLINANEETKESEKE